MGMRNMTRAGILALTLLLATAGCSANRGKVTLRGDEGNILYAQSFNQAYIASSHDGEYDVLLVQDTQSPPAKSGNKKSWTSYVWPGAATPEARPLQPLSGAQLKQVVHIHVFWQAQGGSVARDGVVTNAAIDWYVLANEESDRPEILHYEGAGYVLLDEGKNATTVDIRDGSMKKSQATTGLTDPLGPTTLRGKVKAQPNPQFVRETLANLKPQPTPAANTALSQSR